MEAFLRVLLSLTLGGSVLAALLILLRRLLKDRLPATFAYLAWLLVLLRFVLPLPGLLPAADRAPVRSEPVPVAAVRPAEPSAAPVTPRVYETERRIPSTETAVATLPAAESAAEMRAALDFGKVRAAARSLLRDWDFWGGVWLFGACLSLLWYTAGYLRFRRLLCGSFLPARESDLAVLRALGEGRAPALCRSRLVRTPLLLGLFRPVVVLPERDYDDEMLRGILRHELIHCRRGDIAVKWFAVLVSCLHWFNPLLAPIRRRIDRACELSCDERLLRRMGRDEKQYYGELLLSLAAERPLPRRVVAVSFATEKRDLKERLMQIMKYKHTGRAGLALALAAILLLSGCGAVLGPNTANVAQAAQTVSDEAISGVVISAEESAGAEQDGSLPAETIEVGSVDELIAAIGSDRVLRLAEGEYDLTKAASYGGDTGSDCVSWIDAYDGWELAVSGVRNLYIVGQGALSTCIVTVPRYANVLHFDWCTNVQLSAFTAGHTEEPGYCSGGVLYFAHCDDMAVTACDLYGCGTMGVSAFSCRGVYVTDTTVRECSYGAVEAYDSFDIRFIGGTIRDCGLKTGTGAFDLLSAQSSTGFAVFNTEICGNRAESLLRSGSSLAVQIRGCSVHDNTLGRTDISYNEGGAPSAWFYGAVFHISGVSPVIADCAFIDNVYDGAGMYFNYDGETRGVVTDAEGAALKLGDLETMQLKRYDEPYNGPVTVSATPPAGETNEYGETVYHVDNADDFLAAIGSNATIYVDAALIDFSEAADYGGYGSGAYYWYSSFDGPSLVISGVENLHIIGMGRDQTVLQAVPRYADVLNFTDCRNVSVESLTAGHLKEEPGSCAGDVLEFNNCGEVSVKDCGLFGCGVNGIVASGCQGLTVEDTEIYECSNQGAQLFNCFGARFTGCSIHDCAYDSIYVYNTSNAYWDGKVLRGGNNSVA